MKNHLLPVLLCTLFVAPAYASKDRGGGDLCENRIGEIADDIDAWIKKGGADALNLPDGVTLQTYTTGMRNAIASAKVRCVKPGDDGYPVKINDTPKVCRFDHTQSDMFITCDYSTFMNSSLTSDSDQYTLIHHEYAGLAGVENPDGDVSTYKISNQISYFLDEVTVKKLAVKPPQPTNAENPVCNMEMMLPQVQDALKTVAASYSDQLLKINLATIQVHCLGKSEYQDTGKARLENAFDVSFKTDSGTELSLRTEPLNFPGEPHAPYYKIFSIPDPVIEKKYDEEGKFTHSECVVKSDLDLYSSGRMGYVVNKSTDRYVTAFSVPLVLATKDIGKQ